MLSRWVWMRGSGKETETCGNVDYNNYSQVCQRAGTGKPQHMDQI